MAEHATPERPHDGRFGERFDAEIDLRGVFWVAAGIVVTTVVGMLITWWAWKAFLKAPAADAAQVPAIALPSPPRLPTNAPLLQSHPETELEALREEMAHELESWELRGETAKVPVEVAIEVLLARGVPSRPAPEPVAGAAAPAATAPAAAPAPASPGHGG